MTPVWLMTAGSVLSAAVASAATEAGSEIWLGMLAPLLVVVGTWILTERVYKRRPDLVMSVMVSAFAGKLVFFGAYVIVAIAVLHVQPAPFITSLTGYFIALHMVEALWLKRLFVS